MKKILVTGCAGFIGFHVCKKLFFTKSNVIGIDNLNSYYDLNLKKARLRELEKLSENLNIKFSFIKADIQNHDLIKKIFQDEKITQVIHLAAQAGVRYSITNPYEYIDSNLKGFLNILEASKLNKINHLIFASSSSVYGGNKKYPYAENDDVSHPVSLYAATKKANELMAHTYSHLYQIPCTGLRLFTVYGPWGRPDMAPMLFAKAIISGKPIKLFNNGDMERDFTYIDDVVEAILKILEKPPSKDTAYDYINQNASTSWAPYKIFNIGNKDPINISDFLKILECEIDKVALREYVKMPPGDVKKTFANTKLLEEWIDYSPKTPIKQGIKSFIKWYKDFYK